MKISVVIPNYKDVRIQRTLKSIYSQTFRNFETIVVDGSPPNNYLNDIYQAFPLDVLIQEKDNGIFDALNKGIKKATGDVIYLLGSDDVLSDTTVFEKVNQEFEHNSRLDGVCIGCEFVNGSGQVIRTWHPRSVSSRKILSGIYPPHFSLFLKKELYGLVGRFEYEKTENIATDTLWLLDLALKKPDLNIKVIRNVHLMMEYGGASTGSLKRIAKQFVVVHRYAKYNKLPLWMIHSFIKTISKVFQFIRI